MISALFKAFAQLSDPRMRRVLRIGILSALACWATLAVIASVVVTHTHFFDVSWADTSAGLALGAVGVIVPVLFFSALATFVMSFFLEDIAEVVESRHYPDLGPSRRPHWREILASSTRFLVVMVAVTMLAAPVYLALLFFGLGLILNYLVNGYLLGREYFELVASRRLTPDQVRAQLHFNFTRLWLCGAVINFLFQIPLLNLAAPVLGTAFMVHIVQSLPPAPPPEQVPA
ncbi:EI24 domain-containing protein [Magnetospirillum molischianum]|uniref:CysZ-like protein n=1 Tax=Magnetospirillum molischianum DSM 120 TaxID=1150626 RepID=H8FTH6_MAGML|nr:EI24 domain-containing protein [Magnetospirillum molischianum]CCG41664.1 conserved membrane hypothetical protein [Magnetospirillum molischianum DSM 120]